MEKAEKRLSFLMRKLGDLMKTEEHPQQTLDVSAEPQGLCVWTQEMLYFSLLKAVTRGCKAPNDY